MAWGAAHSRGPAAHPAPPLPTSPCSARRSPVPPPSQAAVETEHTYRHILAFTAFMAAYLTALWLQAAAYRTADVVGTLRSLLLPGTLHRQKGGPCRSASAWLRPRTERHIAPVHHWLATTAPAACPTKTCPPSASQAAPPAPGLAAAVRCWITSRAGWWRRTGATPCAVTAPARRPLSLRPLGGLGASERKKAGLGSQGPVVQSCSGLEGWLVL